MCNFCVFLQIKDKIIFYLEALPKKGLIRLLEGEIWLKKYAEDRKFYKNLPAERLNMKIRQTFLSRNKKSTHHF